MRLDELLKVCNSQELAELHAFWNGEGERMPQGDALLGAVAECMRNDVKVLRRLRFLSRRLLDLLRYCLSRRDYEADFDAVRGSRAFSSMSLNEVEAGVRALVKRGFLFPRRRTAGTSQQFVIPEELGELLRREIQDLDLELKDAFTLRGNLVSASIQASAQGAGSANGSAPASEGPDGAGSNGGAPEVNGVSVEALLAQLVDPRSIEARVQSLPSPVREIFDKAVSQGGLLSRSTFARQPDCDALFDQRTLKLELEKRFLGTVRHLALGEYGINHFDETVVLFDEILHALLQRPAPPLKGGALHERSLGVDLLSDLSHLLGRMAHENVRLTQSGQVYRTAARKIEEELILASKGVLEPDRLFEFVLDMAVRRHLVRRSSDRHLALTGKGRTWPRMSATLKLRELLSGILECQGAGFHEENLRDFCLHKLQGLECERWYDFSVAVGWLRNQYLCSLDDKGLRSAYQSRYQYSSEAHMCDVGQLSATIADFLTRDLHLLGLVDVCLEGNRIVALRMSALAAKVLGVEAEADPSSSATRLVVNPDFEVMILPDGEAFELIQKVDRFAERLSTEGVFRYRITPRSVERAVAGGMSAAEILEVLSENSSSELPQNIVFSIRDYADKVRFVQVRRALILSARHKEVVDHLLRRAEIRRHVIDRPTPRMIALDAQMPFEELLPLLEEDGVFLLGDAASLEESPSATTLTPGADGSATERSDLAPDGDGLGAPAGVPPTE